jgi:hypothetical protein
LRGQVLTNGRRPLYIDLLNAYPEGPKGLMTEYVDAMDKPGAAARVLQRRNINYIVLGAHRRKSQMVKYLSGTGRAS